MKRWHAIVLVMVALIVPGTASYLVGRALKSDSRYVALPPERRQEAATPTVVHGQETPASAEQASPGTSGSGSAETRRTPGDAAQTDSARRMTGGQQSGTRSEGSANRNSGTAAERPAGEGGPEGRRRFQMPEEFQQTFALVRYFRGIGRLEEEGENALTSAQAKAILAVMTPLRTQAKLTPAQAGQAQKKLEAVLTVAQREAITEGMDRFRRGGGGPGGPPPEGAQRPEGAPRPEGTQAGRGAQDAAPRPGGRPAQGRPGGDGAGPGAEGRPAMPPPPDMTNVNPFNTSTDNPMAARMSERIQAVFTALEAKAKQ